MTEMQKLAALSKAHQGILRSSVLNQNGFHCHKIRSLVNDGVLTQIRRGYYQYSESNVFSDIPILAALFPDGVLCMESALDHYGYTNRTPAAWQIAVHAKTARARFVIDYLPVKPHFIVGSRFPIGMTMAEIDGCNIQIYDRERTICDCLMHRNKMDAEVFNDAIKGYLHDDHRRPAVLADYAAKLRIEKKVREVLGIWL